MPGAPFLYSPSTIGAPVSFGQVNIYELFRNLIRSAHWTRENELDALGLVDKLEEVGFFGTLGDTVKSKEVEV